jgi:hypothetical protein
MGIVFLFLSFAAINSKVTNKGRITNQDNSGTVGEGDGLEKVAVGGLGVGNEFKSGAWGFGVVKNGV